MTDSIFRTDIRSNFKYEIIKDYNKNKVINYMNEQ